MAEEPVKLPARESGRSRADGTSPAVPTADAAHLFEGSGEMRARCRELDWGATALDPVEAWSVTLRTTARLVVDSPFAAVLLWGPNLIQIYNDGYRELMGIKHPSGLGQATRECWPEVWHINAPIYERVWRGESVAFENALYPIRRSGMLEDAWFTLSYSPVRDESGGVAGVLVVVFETTSQLRAQAALRDSEARHRALATASADVLYRMSPDWAEMRQLDGRGFIQDTLEPSDTWFERYIHPHDQPRVAAAIRDAIAGKRIFELDHRVVRADGTLGWTSSRAVPLLGSDGEILEWIGAASDVSARHEAETALRESEARSRTLVENVRDYAIFLLNVDGLITEWTAGAERVKGYTAAEVIGQPLAVFYTPEDVAADAPQRELAEAAATGRAEREGWRVRKGGERFWVNEIATAVHDPDGRVVGFTKISRDLTERRRAEERVAASVEAQRTALNAAEAARVDAEAANRSKSEFLAVMSHELRTPLNAIGGYAELIEMGIRGPITEAQRADLARIRKSQRHLLGLINEVLNYAKIDAGAVYYEVTDVPLDELITTCESLVAPQASSKRLALMFTGCEPGRSARADRDKVQQIVLNLLSNAIKFTNPGGRVSVECATVHRAGDGPHVILQVRDTGCGIAPEQCERVFQPFVQINTQLTRTQEGTGLGLAISRDLARGMGGDLTVESTLGEGSTFTLTLPGASGSA